MNSSRNSISNETISNELCLIGSFFPIVFILEQKEKILLSNPQQNDSIFSYLRNLHGLAMRFLERKSSKNMVTRIGEFNEVTIFGKIETISRKFGNLKFYDLQLTIITTFFDIKR
jgi:hypothetical protein